MRPFLNRLSISLMVSFLSPASERALFKSLIVQQVYMLVKSTISALYLIFSVSIIIFLSSSFGYLGNILDP